VIRRLAARVRRLVQRCRAGAGTAALDGQVGIGDDIRVRAYRVDRFAGWNELDREQRYRRVRAAAPNEEAVAENVITVDYLEHLVDVFTQDQAAAPKRFTHIALGTDDSEKSKGDSSLGNEVFRGSITDEKDQGTDSFNSLFLDSGEANGNDLVEAALATGAASDSDAILVNLGTFETIAKTDAKVATIDITIKNRND